MPDPIQNVEIVELQGKLKNAQTRVHQCFEEAKTERDGTTVHDFSKVKVYGKNAAGEPFSTTEIAEKVRADNAEMNDFGEKLQILREAQAAYTALNAPAKQMQHPGEGDQYKDRRHGKQFKSLGMKIGDLVKESQESGGLRNLLKIKGEIEIPGVSVNEFKTLFQTSVGDGWVPESIRSGLVVPDVTRPIQLLDLMPTGSIGQAAAVYMEETTRTHAAAETDEGDTYKESTFVLTEQSKTVRKITDSIPVTDEQLEDVPQAETYLSDRIRFGVRQRLDFQMLNGNDASPNLAGILNVGGIQTQAKGGDPVPDAFYKAMDLILVTGRAMPTAHVIHPTDWQGVRLLRTADGIYIWGNPSEAGPMRLWGLPVALSDAITVNTGLVGSFEVAWIQLLERRGIILEMGFTGSQFVEGKQTIRASLRAVLVTYRPAAFCTVTGI